MIREPESTKTLADALIVELPAAHAWNREQDLGSRSYSPDYWRGWNAYHDQTIDVLKRHLAGQQLAEQPLKFDLDEVCEFVLEVQSAICLIDQDPAFARKRIEAQCERLWVRMITEHWTGMGAWTNSGKGLRRSWQPEVVPGVKHAKNGDEAYTASNKPIWRCSAPQCLHFAYYPEEHFE